MHDVRVVFMGTPDFSVPLLKMLIENTNVVLVVTQPDKEVGRKKEIQKTPVKVIALENNIEVFQPVKIRNDFKRIEEVKPDLIVTCAYGQIVSEDVLRIPKLGCINVHASLLPKYRGAAPIQWALINGEEKTGITLMYMDKGMDTGDIIAMREWPILDSDNVGTLHDKLSLLGASFLKENLEKIVHEENERIKQNDDEATYAPMIKREDERLNFDDLGINIVNKVRALNPWPLANIILDNEEIKIVEVEFEKKSVTRSGEIIADKNNFGITSLDGIIYFKVIKPSGKKKMNIKDYLNGQNIDALRKKQILK